MQIQFFTNLLNPRLINIRVTNSRPLWREASRRFENVFAKVEGIIDRKTPWALSVIILLSIQLTLTLKHEPWLDEYQALQIALQSPNLAALLENLRYEGHPPLWYFLIQATAIAVPASWILPVIQAAICLSLQYLILFRSPFCRLNRILIGSSFFVLFEYGAISRSLSLGVLFTTIFFASRNTKIKWLAISVLPAIDFLFGILSIILIIINAQERRMWWIGISLWVVVGFISAWTIRPAPDMVPALQPVHSLLFEIVIHISKLSVLLVPLQFGTDGLQWDKPLPAFLAPTLGLWFVLFSFLQMRRVKTHLYAVISFTALTFIFAIFVYALPIRHLTLIAYLLILLKWREQEMGFTPNTSFNFWLVIISICGLITTSINFAKPFDSAFLAAKYIKDSGLENKHWVYLPDYGSQGVSALLGIEFHRIGDDCTQSFKRWNLKTKIETKKQLDRFVNPIIKKYGRFYLLSSKKISISINSKNYSFLKHIKPGYDGINYYMYIVAPQLPERGARPPQCPPSRLPLALWQRGERTRASFPH